MLVLPFLVCLLFKSHKQRNEHFNDFKDNVLLDEGQKNKILLAYSNINKYEMEFDEFDKNEIKYLNLNVNGDGEINLDFSLFDKIYLFINDCYNSKLKDY